MNIQSAVVTGKSLSPDQSVVVHGTPTVKIVGTPAVQVRNVPTVEIKGSPHVVVDTVPTDIPSLIVAIAAALLAALALAVGWRTLRDVLRRAKLSLRFDGARTNASGIGKKKKANGAWRNEFRLYVRNEGARGVANVGVRLWAPEEYEFELPYVLEGPVGVRDGKQYQSWVAHCNVPAYPGFDAILPALIVAGRDIPDVDEIFYWQIGSDDGTFPKPKLFGELRFRIRQTECDEVGLYRVQFADFANKTTLTTSEGGAQVPLFLGNASSEDLSSCQVVLLIERGDYVIAGVDEFVYQGDIEYRRELSQQPSLYAKFAADVDSTVMPHGERRVGGLRINFPKSSPRVVGVGFSVRVRGDFYPGSGPDTYGWIDATLLRPDLW